MENKITFQIEKSIGSLKANFDALKNSVKVSVAKYHGLVYTDDQIAEAKRDLATLRAERKKIDDARKSVKAEFIKPYEDFEKQVKETLSIYDSAIAEINEQVQTAETAYKSRKKAEIEQWWKENGVKSIEGVTLAKVWDERYLNKTCTANKWQADLSAKKNRIEADLKSLSLMPAEKLNFLLPTYLETLDIADAQRKLEQFEANRRATEEARKAMAMKQAQEAQKVVQKPVEQKTEEQPKPQQMAREMAENTPKKVYHMTFEITGYEAQTKELCDTLRKLKATGGLTFKVIESKVEEE